MVKLRLKMFAIGSNRNCSNFTIIEAGREGTSSLNYAISEKISDRGDTAKRCEHRTPLSERLEQAN